MSLFTDLVDVFNESTWHFRETEVDVSERKKKNQVIFYDRIPHYVDDELRNLSRKRCSLRESVNLDSPHHHHLDSRHVYDLWKLKRWKNGLLLRDPDGADHEKRWEHGLDQFLLALEHSLDNKHNTEYPQSLSLSRMFRSTFSDRNWSEQLQHRNWREGGREKKRGKPTNPIEFPILVYDSSTGEYHSHVPRALASA